MALDLLLKMQKTRLKVFIIVSLINGVSILILNQCPDIFCITVLKVRLHYLCLLQVLVFAHVLRDHGYSCQFSENLSRLNINFHQLRSIPLVLQGLLSIRLKTNEIVFPCALLVIAGNCCFDGAARYVMIHLKTMGMKCSKIN